MKTIVSLIYCVVAALGAVTVLSAQDVQTIWPVALAVALGTWLSASLITHHYAQRPARQDKPSITAAAGAQTGKFPHGGDSRFTYAYIEESTWQWLQRNHLPGLPGRDNVELELISILVAVDPFVEPKPGELRYDAQIEHEFDGSNPHSYVRLYRRGVFVGYDIRRTSRLEIHPQEREYNPLVTPTLDGETTWQWIQRNHLTGLPGRNNMELEPRRTLIATQPFAKPKVGEQLYDTKIELEIQGENKRGYYRFYRRGVFAGYDIPVPSA
ncbi:MAG: hypothetical protein Udaeo2_25040 [Candidatus Udaeobacter sp.]|nr:MAG: hypothetical protein Udaeo2_25040 [Candidatus Udaeobacter sp.]